MKINVEFNGVVDMVNFARFITDQSSTAEDKKKLADYERMLHNAQNQLERAYARIRGEDADKYDKALLDKGIENLDLTVRAYNCLIAEKVNTIGQLVNMTRNELMAIPNLGSGTLRQILAELNKHGLKLKKDEV